MPLIWLFLQRWAHPRAQQTGSPKKELNTSKELSKWFLSARPVPALRREVPGIRVNWTHFRAQQLDARPIKLAFSGPKMKSSRHWGRDFQSPLHRGILFNRFLSLAVSTTCRQYSSRFSATVLSAEKPGRFAKIPIECASEPNIRRYPRNSYGIRSPRSDYGTGSEEARSHPESLHGFLPADQEFVF